MNRMATAFTSALWSTATDTTPVHCAEDEYRRYLDGLDISRGMKNDYLSVRRVFASALPDLADWFAQPLDIRIGRVFGTSPFHPDHPAPFTARQYLYYLALTDRIRLDYAYLLSIAPMYARSVASALNVDLGLPDITKRFEAMAFSVATPIAPLIWTVSRLAMRTGIRSPEAISTADLGVLDAAIDAYVGSPDMLRLLGYDARSGARVAHQWHGYVRTTRLILHHMGNPIACPRMSAVKRPPHDHPRPELGALIERWLEIKRATFAKTTVDHIAVSLRRFVDFLDRSEPRVVTFADVTASVTTTFLLDLRRQRGERTGRLLSITAERARALRVAQFLAEGAAWEWPD